MWAKIKKLVAKNLKFLVTQPIIVKTINGMNLIFGSMLNKVKNLLTRILELVTTQPKILKFIYFMNFIIASMLNKMKNLLTRILKFITTQPKILKFIGFMGFIFSSMLNKMKNLLARIFEFITTQPKILKFIDFMNFIIGSMLNKMKNLLTRISELITITQPKILKFIYFMNFIIGSMLNKMKNLLTRISELVTIIQPKILKFIGFMGFIFSSMLSKMKNLIFSSFEYLKVQLPQIFRFMFFSILILILCALAVASHLQLLYVCLIYSILGIFFLIKCYAKEWFVGWKLIYFETKYGNAPLDKGNIFFILFRQLIIAYSLWEFPDKWFLLSLLCLLLLKGFLFVISDYLGVKFLEDKIRKGAEIMENYWYSDFKKLKVFLNMCHMGTALTFLLVLAHGICLKLYLPVSIITRNVEAFLIIINVQLLFELCASLYVSFFICKKEKLPFKTFGIIIFKIFLILLVDFVILLMYYQKFFLSFISL